VNRTIVIGSLVAIFSLTIGSMTMLFMMPQSVYAPSHPVKSDDGGGQICIQVITKARNPTTGEVKNFPTPCDVPKGWVICKVDECKSTKDDVKKRPKVPHRYKTR
jgi:hypothetical protein